PVTVRRGQEQRSALRIQQYRCSQRDFFGCSFLPLLRNYFLKAELPCLAEFCYRAEQALRRLWCADRCSQLHHCLVPVTRRLPRKKVVRAYLQSLPAPSLAQISTHRFDPRDHSRHISVKHRELGAIRDAQDCRYRVRTNSRQIEGLVGVARKYSRVLRHDLPSSRLQVAR